MAEERRVVGRRIRRLAVATAVWLLVIAPRPTGALPASDTPPPEVAKLYDAGSYSRAIDVLQAAAQKDPKDVSLFYWLGRCYFEQRDFDHAADSLERAVALAPERSAYHDWLGRAYGRKAEKSSHANMVGALEMAKHTHHEFEAAVQLDPHNLAAQRDLISFMASAPSSLGGGETNALAQIKVLSAVDAVEGLLALADLYAEKKKFAQADEEYQKALQAAPGRIEPYLEAADYYADRGDAAHMEGAVGGATKVASSDRRLSYYRGVLLVLEKKDPDTAAKELRTYLETVPDNSELPSHRAAHAYLGQLYEEQGKPDQASEQYQAALALDPHNKAIRDALKRVQKK